VTWCDGSSCPAGLGRRFETFGRSKDHQGFRFGPPKSFAAAAANWARGSFGSAAKNRIVRCPSGRGTGPATSLDDARSDRFGGWGFGSIQARSVQDLWCGGACIAKPGERDRRSKWSPWLSREVLRRVVVILMGATGLLAAVAGLARPGNGAAGKRKPRRFYVHRAG